MGVVYHARYLVWLDVARCEHLRLTGLSYRELEERGYRMVVAELGMRYLRGARYDDEVRVRCWVRRWPRGRWCSAMRWTGCRRRVAGDGPHDDVRPRCRHASRPAAGRCGLLAPHVPRPGPDS